MNTSTDIYADIAKRTGGDIYIGVVGPVRTGKSTLIKRMMETLVLPNIESEEARERANDELPQSASGKTIMTTEPKFIPEKACEVLIGGKTRCRVKLIDCVGYLVPDAAGHIENEQPRMVMTPWSDEAMPFEKAAETGTRRVINEHSTVAIAVTTDGSICGIPRANYAEAEKRVVKELTDRNKPFVLVLNSADPSSENAKELKKALAEEYGCPVYLTNCYTAGENEIRDMLYEILMQFPPREISVMIPGWITNLDDDDELRSSLFRCVTEKMLSVRKNRDTERAAADIKASSDAVDDVYLVDRDMGTGNVRYKLTVKDGVFFRALGKSCGADIADGEELFEVMAQLSEAKKGYDKIKAALDEVEKTGYGIVTPPVSELTLEKPELIKHSGGYGIKFKTVAPSVHMIKAKIETEVSPIIGNEKQSEDMVDFLKKEMEENPEKIWETNIFGKTLKELVSEGVNAKLSHISPASRTKLCDTMSKIINEGSGGLICIIL